MTAAGMPPAATVDWSREESDMPGLSGALDIARWSMYASQLAIEVTSNNIANANTAGYSKQTLELQANNSIMYGPGQLGTGVKATQVTRAYDRFVSQQLVFKNSTASYWDAQKTSMGEIETIFNESDEYGVNYLMSQFWNAWSDLANNVDATPERNSLLAKTSNLTSAVKSIDYNLRAYKKYIDSNVQNAVTQANTLIKTIADLNESITAGEIKGVENANGLRDQRDSAIKELSSYMDINYYEDEASGQMQVFILGGTPLVLGKTAYQLSTAANTTNSTTDVMWNDNTTPPRQLNITDKLSGGKLAGWVNVRDTKIDGYLDSMNTLFKEVIWQVNSLHSEASGLSPVASTTGTVKGITATDNLGADFGFSSRYNATGSFDMITYDAAGNKLNNFTINPAGNTVQDYINAINATGQLTASLTADGRFQIAASGAASKFTVCPTSGGTSDGSLAIMGVNSFFTWNDDMTATDVTQTIDVNAALVANPDLVGAGHPDSTGKIGKGDNSVAKAIYGLQDKVLTMGGNSTTMDAYYSSLISTVGVDVQNATMNKSYNAALQSQYEQRLESIAGVNMDEEMASLLKFQQSYQAAAKIIQMADEMFKSLLSSAA